MARITNIFRGLPLPIILSGLAATCPAQAQTAEVWQVVGPLSIQAINADAAEIAMLPTDPGDVATLRDIVIMSGSRNSISMSAIGATASASVVASGSTDFSAVRVFDSDIAVSATNLAPISNTGTIENATIQSGVQNGISRSAVGASAALSSFFHVTGGADAELAFSTTGDITISADNEAPVSLRTDIVGAQIASGDDNTISGSAVGASASLSLQAVVEGGSTGTINYSVSPDAMITVSATNSGDVTLSSAIDEGAPATFSDLSFGTDSKRGTISLTAVGASATISVATYLYDSDATITSEFGEYTLSATNTGAVSANVSIDGLTVEEGTNSINFGSMGTVIGFSQKIYGSADGADPAPTTMPTPQWQSSNEGSVVVDTVLNDITIVGGINRSVGVTSAGAMLNFGPQW